MGTAICFKCGYEKFSALIACRNCKAAPKTNSEYAISLALSDHLSTNDQLAQYSYALRNAKKLSVPRETLVQAFDALKDPQLLAMLEAQSVVQEATPPLPSPRPTPSQLQAPAALHPAPSPPMPPPIPHKPEPRFAATALNKSPFAVLGVTTRDDRRRIVELAEAKSLELDHELCQKARSDLTNPRTRLSAEIAWLPGVSPRKASQLVDGLLQNPMAVRQESGLPTLAHLNLMASAFETVRDSHDSNDLAEFIQEVANLAEELYSGEVLRDINEDRSVAGFPEVKTIEQVEDELSERKRCCRNAIKEALDRLPSAKLVRVMTDAVDGATLGGEDQAPGLIDDLVDSYEVETQAPLQSGAENIHNLIESAKDAAPSGEAAVKPCVDKIEAAARSWDRIAQPIQLSAKARGTEHDLSSKLGWAIRGLALDLFNKHDILSQTQRLTVLLQELFSEIPEISERVEQDADALGDIAKEREDLAIIAPIKKLSEGITKTAELSPGNAFNEGIRLLQEGSQLLKSLPVTSSSNAYKQANNILAHGGNRCAIDFGNATSKWAPCIILLERSLSLASDADLRNRISENLTLVKNNLASLGDLEPISSAPSLHTINACGFTMYGSSDHRPDGSYMTTYYFVILAIPLFPIARYRVMHAGGNSYRFLGKGRLRTFDKWHIAITLGAIGLMILL